VSGNEGYECAAANQHKGIRASWISWFPETLQQT